VHEGRQEGRDPGRSDRELRPAREKDQGQAGCGDEEYAEALETVVAPALEAFEPDLLLVSAGFDTAAGDPIGGMLVTEEGFSALARRAGMICSRVALVLEGGYNIETLPRLVGAVLAAL